MSKELVLALWPNNKNSKKRNNKYDNTINLFYQTGHDYYGRSSGPNSLLIWTHSMRNMEFHDNFIPAGYEGNDGMSAVTLEAGLTWLDVYAAASVDRGLYVQGGGCTRYLINDRHKDTSKL